MSQIITASGLEGSLPLTTPASQTTGVFSGFPLPQSGPWSVTVPLSTDSDCPVSATVQLTQTSENGTVVIASQTCTLSNTPTNCTLNVATPPPAGECSVSGLGILITASEVCTSCCNIGLVDLHYTLTGGGVICTQVGTTLAYSGNPGTGPVWNAAYNCCGQPGVIVLRCNSTTGVWTFTGNVGALNFSVTSLTVACSPFQITVTGNASGGTCTNPLALTFVITL